jgi:hypothetical protein
LDGLIKENELTTLIDLGWCIAKLDEKGSVLTIVSPSYQDEQCLTPAESVRIIGKEGLIKLRDALNTAYPKDN